MALTQQQQFTGSNLVMQPAPAPQNPTTDRVNGVSQVPGIPNANGTPYASPFAPQSPLPQGNAIQPVITSASAQADIAKKFAIFQDLQNQVKNQQSVLAQQAAQRAADEAASQLEKARNNLEQQKIGIEQQTADIAAKDAESKRIALGMSNSTTASGFNQGAYDSFKANNPDLAHSQVEAPQPQNTSQVGDIAQQGIGDAMAEKQAQLSAIQNAQDQVTQQSIQALQSLQQGTIPLSGPQSALIGSLQQQLVQNVQDQKQANASYTGALTTSLMRSGGEYTPEQTAGAIHNSITLGVQKIQSLDNSAAMAIANLEQEFQKDNYEIFNSQYEKLTKTLDAKAQAIQDTYKDTVAAIKDARDFEATQIQRNFENMMTSDKFTYQQKQDAIDNAFKAGQISETKRHNLTMEAAQKEPTAKEKKEIEGALKNAKASIPIMQDKIAAIDVLKQSSGLNSRVGPNALTRKGSLSGTIGGAVTGAIAGGTVGATVGGFGAIPGAIGGAVIGGGAAASRGAADDFTGAGQDFASGVHKLVSGLTLQSLIDAKARGATFGALSEGELDILANSASQLNDWEIKKDGKPTGVWNIDEKSFKKELDNIQNLTRRALVLSNESLISDDEDSSLDSIFGQPGTSNQALDPSLYY